MKIKSCTGTVTTNEKLQKEDKKKYAKLPYVNIKSVKCQLDPCAPVRLNFTNFSNDIFICSINIMKNIDLIKNYCEQDNFETSIFNIFNKVPPKPGNSVPPCKYTQWTGISSGLIN